MAPPRSQVTAVGELLKKSSMHHHDVKDNAAAAGTEEKVKHI
jgi:hypothetical protein